MLLAFFDEVMQQMGSATSAGKAGETDAVVSLNEVFNKFHLFCQVLHLLSTVMQSYCIIHDQSVN